jgi:hypothetical protein
MEYVCEKFCFLEWKSIPTIGKKKAAITQKKETQDIIPAGKSFIMRNSR